MYLNSNIEKAKIGGNKLDVLKLLLSLLILFLHSNAFPIYFLPIFRTAVPLFFIMSSYFFFSKTRNIDHKEERINILIYYLKRLFFLKLFWTIVFFIPNALQRQWFDHDFPFSLCLFLKSLIFSSTFQASWFLSSTIIATAILYWLIYEVKMADWLILIISLILYLFCCRTSMYMLIIPASSALNTFLHYSNVFIGAPYNGFPVAFVWIIIGKIIAYRDFKVTIRQLALFSSAFLMMAYIEYFLIYQSFEIAHDDCFVSLLVLCPSVFLLLIKIPDINIIYARQLRKISIIIFCCHGTFIWIYNHFEISQLMILLFALLSSLTIGCLVNYFADRFKILRYSY